MTYRELLERLAKLSDKQLDAEVFCYDSWDQYHCDNYLRILEEDEEVPELDGGEDALLPKGTPLLVMRS